jgi:hypothetical protein
MPSLLFKIISIITCFLPAFVFIVLPKFIYINSNYLVIGIGFGMGISAILELILLSYAKRKFGKSTIKFSDAQPVNREMFTFFMASLMPIIAYVIKSEHSFAIGVFITIAITGIVLLSDSYYVNPILGFLGYKVYQVKGSNSVVYLLITKRNINNMEKPKNVVSLTSHIYLLV